MMRIVHLSTSDTRGGAARGAYWLHRALCESGVDSTMLVGRKYSNDKRVLQLAGAMAPAQEKLRGVLDQIPLRRYRKTSEAFWTVGWVPRSLAPAIAALKPDLVHLHWMGAGFVPIDALRTLPYPLVWTLRDMWAFTGGCHYAGPCNRYIEGCGKCPQLQSDRDNDLSRAVWRRKAKAWDGVDLWLVPVSNWLADCARQSPLFATAPIRVIPNGVDGRRFRPVPRHEARSSWGLDPNVKYILFGALGAFRDERKGFAHLAAATRELEKMCWSTRAELLVFGDVVPDSVPGLGLRVHSLGHIEDDQWLAALYSAADVMVAPSVQEAFGKTVIEAMACGTPVVAFAEGGAIDIISHQQNGYLAQPFDPADLARGIAWFLERPDLEDVSTKARGRVEEAFDMGVIAERYRDLYRHILTRAP